MAKGCTVASVLRLTHFLFFQPSYNHRYAIILQCFAYDICINKREYCNRNTTIPYYSCIAVPVGGNSFYFDHHNYLRWAHWIYSRGGGGGGATLYQVYPEVCAED